MRLARVHRTLATLILAVAALGGMGVAWAQALWIELTPEQQMALAPLAAQWPQLNVEQQRNWMAVSHHYARMSPRQRQVLQDRMTAWAALTPSQRNQARFDFNTIKSSRLSDEERRAKWEEYSNLPQAERERLARNRRMPRGTAPALHPPLPGRLVRPPAPPFVAAPVQIPVEGYGAPRRAPRAVIPADRNTLLPREFREGQDHYRHRPY
jgi:hypothetical protein